MFNYKLGRVSKSRVHPILMSKGVYYETTTLIMALFPNNWFPICQIGICLALIWPLINIECIQMRCLFVLVDKNLAFINVCILYILTSFIIMILSFVWRVKTHVTCWVKWSYPRVINCLNIYRHESWEWLQIKSHRRNKLGKHYDMFSCPHFFVMFVNCNYQHFKQPFWPFRHCC